MTQLFASVLKPIKQIYCFVENKNVQDCRFIIIATENRQ